jgi:predicted dehydrogenase
MKRFDLTRREFLHTSAVGASALAMGVGSGARAAEADKEVALGIIGIGGRGSHLLRKAARIEGVRIVAVCDLLTDKVANGQNEVKKANPKNDPKGYTKFQEMIEKEKLDGVIVATEVGNHAKCAVPVLEAGLNCFCEKPMDTTVERVDNLVKAARKAKGFLQIGFQRHYNVGYVKAIEKIHSGDLGKVSFLQGQWHWNWEVGTGGWLNDMDLGGGELVEQAGHHMDVMAWVMKYQHPLECVAMANIMRNIGGTTKPVSEDHTAVLFRFPGDAIFSYTHLFWCPDAFQAEKMWVYGQQWGVDLVKSELHTKGKTEPIAESSGTDWDKGTDGELEAFVEKIRKGDKEKPLSNVETARIATLMCFMGRKAFRDVKSNKFESRIVKWEDLGSTTDM